jgi:hypothetical protein
MVLVVTLPPQPHSVSPSRLRPTWVVTLPALGRHPARTGSSPCPHWVVTLPALVVFSLGPLGSSPCPYSPCCPPCYVFRHAAHVLRRTRLGRARPVALLRSGAGGVAGRRRRQCTRAVRALMGQWGGVPAAWCRGRRGRRAACMHVPAACCSGSVGGVRAWPQYASRSWTNAAVERDEMGNRGWVWVWAKRGRGKRARHRRHAAACPTRSPVHCTGPLHWSPALAPCTGPCTGPLHWSPALVPCTGPCTGPLYWSPALVPCSGPLHWSPVPSRRRLQIR